MCLRTLGIDDSQYEAFSDRADLALLQSFEELFGGLRPCFVQGRTYQRARTLAQGLLCSSHPHTIASWIEALGRQYQDWSGDYDFFSSGSWDAAGLFGVVLGDVAELMGKEWDFWAAIDEVHLPKTGSKVPGISVLRNPTSHLHKTQLHRAQRWLTISALLPTGESLIGPARGIPVGFEHAPPAKRPNRRRASPEDWVEYERQRKLKTISWEAVHALERLRSQMNSVEELAGKKLVVAMDGSLTNSTTLRNIPAGTVLVCRTRKDIRLYAPPAEYSGVGRRRKYGEKLQTPEELRRDESVPWQTMEMWLGGELRAIRYKTVAPVLWKEASQAKPLRLIVLAPLGYRLSATGKKRYREPGYLLVTDINYPMELALQCYLDRWEVEVNHRDAKSIIGVGDPQVWNQKSVEQVPRFAMAVYGLLTLASLKAYGPEMGDHYGRVAAWRNDRRPRPSTATIINEYKQQLQRAGTMSFGRVVSRLAATQPTRNIRQGNTDIRSLPPIRA